MHITAHGKSDIGQRRARNEDAFLIDRRINLFVVSDGMGGHAAGHVAARKATEYVAEYLRDNMEVLREARSVPGGYFKVVELVESATVDTCRRIHDLARSEPLYAGMGTTMTLLLIVDDKAIMSHVGDSRLYLSRDDGMHLLSSDHTLANEMVLQGVLKPEELDASPFQHVLTRSVGSVEAVEAEMLLFDVLPGDTFLLCSDGLTKYLEDSEELLSYLRRYDLAEAPERLIGLANRRGGKDNITAIAIRATADPRAESKAEETRVKFDALRSTFLCQDISYSRLIRLVEISEVRGYAPGDEILRNGSPCEGLYVIVEGRAAASRGGGSAMEFGPGACLCETALSRQRKAKATVVALEPTVVLLLPRPDFGRLTRRFPKIGRLLHTRLLSRFAKRIDSEVTIV